MWALLAAASLTCTGVEDPGCLGSDDPACVPPSPCPTLRYTCAGERFARAARMTRPDQRLPGLAALATPGDLLLENDRVVAFFDAPDHPHHLATSGGALLIFAPRGGVDHLNHVYHITGILPRDGVRYVRWELVNAPDHAAVIFRGALDGYPDIAVVTRYELRPCDPGLRVRTEVRHAGLLPTAWILADAWFWGDRSMTPFAPGRGMGFRHPPLDLVDLDAGWRSFPWMAAQSHAAPDTSYATVACGGRARLDGVNNVNISATGLPRTQVLPGDGLAFERMLFTAQGLGVAGAAGLALDAHSRLNGGATTELVGRVVDAAGAPLGGDERLASLEVYEPAMGGDPDDPAGTTPWSQVVPDVGGGFAVRVPQERTYRVRAHRLGRPAGEALTVRAEGATVSLPDLRVLRPGRIDATVVDETGAALPVAELILVPTGDTDAAQVEGAVHGFFEGCAPYLGPPHGGSPACNRALAPGGRADFAVPDGTYWVYAHGGMGRTLARQRVTVRAGTTEAVRLTLRALPGLFPEGALTGDFHVHGGRSFDTAFPDRERVLSFVSAGVDVVVATDHDVTTSLAAQVEALGLGARVRVMSGLKQTGLVPFLYPPGSSLPRVVGHWNFWPVPYDPTQLNNGAPYDERQEPGSRFDAMRPRLGAPGVIQLNHPVANDKVGRDEGYLRALGYDPRRPLPDRDDGTGVGMLYRRPGGPTGARNLDYDVQEAMNGANVVLNLGYRAVWHQFLSAGILRAGTANSDSHSLGVEAMGYPRNVVLGDFARDRFDPATFNAAVRAGHMLGTNGPVVDARVVTAAGTAQGPSLTAFAPGAGARLVVSVRAPPWVPVTEVRVLVNGRVVRTITDLSRPADPFGADGVVRYTGEVALDPLVEGRDAWVMVEAGMALPPAADTDDDGLVDRIDGDGDGQADDEGMVRRGEDDPRMHLDVVSPGALPFGFTNPFLLDVDGNGWRAPR